MAPSLAELWRQQARHAEFRGTFGGPHCFAERGQFLCAEPVDDEGGAVGDARFTQHALPPHPTVILVLPRPQSNRRPHHEGHKRHRHGSRVHHFIVDGHDHRCAEPDRHDFGDGLLQLDVHADLTVSGACPVSLRI